MCLYTCSVLALDPKSGKIKWLATARSSCLVRRCSAARTSGCRSIRIPSEPGILSDVWQKVLQR
jgi:hypothetical protein